jgi:hypothetical protein
MYLSVHRRQTNVRDVNNHGMFSHFSGVLTYDDARKLNVHAEDSCSRHPGARLSERSQYESPLVELSTVVTKIKDFCLLVGSLSKCTFTNCQYFARKIFVFGLAFPLLMKPA